MNCFSALHNVRRRWLLPGALLMAACGVPASESADRGHTHEYGVHYVLTPDPAASTVHVSLRLEQPRDLVRELSFKVDDRFADIHGDGTLDIHDDRVRWLPRARGGTLEWRVSVNHERGNGRFDALLSPDWGIFRAEDVIPRARTRALKRARSRTTLAFDLPMGWSAISEYPARKHPVLVAQPQRHFDEPTGWIAMGDLGVRREKIAGIWVVIAAPRGQGARRLDMLALLNWTLPELTAILPDRLHRLTIVSAGATMWRGGLSAPASLFLHADRPLISENATSTLLHEVVHTALGAEPRAGFDWIAEGLAEYYSIELLRRGHAITASRAAQSFAREATWSRQATALCTATATGATTALAVTIFRKLDQELSDRSGGRVGLDALLPLIAGKDVDLDTLLVAAEQLIGSTPDALHSENLPGCRSIAAAQLNQDGNRSQ